MVRDSADAVEYFAYQELTAMKQTCIDGFRGRRALAGALRATLANLDGEILAVYRPKKAKVTFAPHGLHLFAFIINKHGRTLLF
ncbi:hypothetical protein M514_21997 [Trichuris suis]|uniref:Uncharacterized protein n=1 Tax=Trichuris suis TaxID=68888 RepID=A0A085N8I9_9BILA|nr:hypothetical protein M514_21997 [Trichuris suis]